MHLCQHELSFPMSLPLSLFPLALAHHMSSSCSSTFFGFVQPRLHLREATSSARTDSLHIWTHTPTRTQTHPTATIKCYKLWVSGEPSLVCPPLEHLCPETRTIAIPCKQCAQNCHVHMFCMCVWDLIGHDSGMHTCTQLELQIYGVKKMKGS